MKYWSLLEGGVTCETLSDVPMVLDGVELHVVSMEGVKDEKGTNIEVFYTITDLKEGWSPIPLEVWDGPASGFLVMSEDGDPYTVAPDEATAKTILKAIEGYGYVPAIFNRNALVTRKV